MLGTGFGMGNGQATPEHDRAFAHFERISLLGEGSHGTVWLARQAMPRREVALKILGSTLASNELKARFQREVELLAMLEHPNIARLYESGTVEGPSGPVPWLSMEYIAGQPLHEWIAAASPSLAQRVALLEELCRAVHFAHTRGVIHRDLKPANILVDEHGHPHIVDFGIASALDRSDLGRVTIAGSVLGTLAYMSPEQLDGSGSIDPRWDVHALGVIAYELLAGTLPYPGLAGTTSVIAAIKTVGSQSPVPLGRASPAARGDLEAVVMKAIAPDPGDRYGSAIELANDLQRWQEGRPVEATPPTPWRLLHLFIRRHRAWAVAAAAVAAVLVIATAVSIRFAMSEAQALREAELRLAQRDSVNAFLTDMLRSADPEQGAGSDIRVREWLATTDASFQSRAEELPAEVRQSLAQTLGTALLHLGEPALAQPRLGEAVGLARELYGEGAPVTLAASIDAALASSGTDPAASEAALRGILDAASRQDDDTLRLEAGIALASHLESQGRIDDAFTVSSSLLDLARDAADSGNQAALSALHNHAALLKYRGDFAAAEPITRDVHQRQLTALGTGHPLTLYAQNQLGGILDRLGRQDEAEAIYRDTLAARRKSLGERHPSTLVTLNNLSALLIQRGSLDEAKPLLDTLVEATRERFGNDAPRTLMAMNQRAYLLEDLGQLDEAEAQLRTIVSTLEAQGGDIHPERLAPRSNLAMLLSKQGRHDEAVVGMRGVVNDASTALGDDHPYVGIFRSNFGEILGKAGHKSEARLEFMRAQAILDAKLGPEHARSQRNRERLRALDGNA